MIGLLQRVSNASVTVDDELVGEIGRGLLVFVAVHRDDKETDVARLAERILTYRVFPDAADRMNRSLIDESLGLLLVPQFTLAADTRKAPPWRGAERSEAGWVEPAMRTSTTQNLTALLFSGGESFLLSSR